MSNNRLEYLDALRGLAVLGVMLCHYIPHLTEIYHLTFDISEYAIKGRYGVHLFFIISGYVIYMTTSKLDSPLQFGIARFSRLFPVFWVAVTLSYLIILFFGHPLGKETPSSMTYLANLTMLHRFLLIPSVDPVYWSLTFELMFYFYIGICMAFKLHHRIQIVVYCWLLFSIALTSWTLYQDIAMAERWKGLFILEFNSFFLTGIAFYQHHQHNNYKMLISTLVLSLLQQYLIADLELVVVYVIAISLFFLFSHYQITGRQLLSKLGKVSYSLYLVHAIPGHSVIVFLHQAGIPAVLNLMFTSTLAILFATGLWCMIEVPGQNRLRHMLTTVFNASNKR